MKSSMQWCRLYHEARTDPKLKVLTLAERGVWSNLLSYASEQTERGTFDASERYILALECADGDEAILNSTIDKLIRVKHLVLSDNSQRLGFRTWNERQYNKPSDAPEATQARQEKRRHALSRAVTPQEVEAEVDPELERVSKTVVVEQPYPKEASAAASANLSLFDQVQNAANLRSDLMITLVSDYAPRLQERGHNIVTEARLWRDKTPSERRNANSFKRWIDNLLNEPLRNVAAANNEPRRQRKIVPAGK